MSGVRTGGLFLFSAAVFLGGGASTVRGQSALDGFDPNADGVINVMVVQPDGKILLGGAFTTLAPNDGPSVTRNHIARLNPDGTLDPGFNPNSDHIVNAIAVQADGKILVGGWFTSIGGQTRNHIAQLDPITGLADSFDPNANDVIYSIAVQADGKILAGGSFTNIGGLARNKIARIDPVTGQSDFFFNPNADSTVISIVVQPDGRILAGGSFTEIGGQSRNGLARLDPVTGLADSFNPNARNNLISGVVADIAVQADGKILAAGNFVEIGGRIRFYLARLDPETGLADSFDPKASSFVEAIAVQADGKILVGGIFHGIYGIGGQARNYMARLDPETGLADSFNPNAGDFVTSIAVQADGKVLAGGMFNEFAPNDGETVTRNRIARLEPDGRLDRTLDPRMPGATVTATAVQPDGKILISGHFFSVSGVPRNRMARLNADGTLDPAFDPDMDGFAISIIVQVDGKILVGGGFNSVGGVTRNHLARLHATTGAADSFDPNVNDDVYSLAVQADGKILAGGNFTRIGAQTRNHIARLDPTTGLVDSFDPNASFIVESLAVQADGKILAGGNFTSIGGQARNYMARLDATTGQADSFNPDLDNSVYSIAVQPDGKILLGGLFTSIGGQLRNRIARVDSGTGLPDSFNPNATAQVQSIAVQADGKILVGGSFTSIGGQTRNYIARLDPSTGLADSFDPNAGNLLFSIALQADGKILASGFFATMGGQTRDSFARLTNDIAALQDLAVTRTAITWTRGGSSPHLTRVTFESSPDNVNYTPLGHGTATGRNWTLTGVSLPLAENFYIRARGYYRGGWLNSSESITELGRNVFLAPAAQPINLSTRMFVQTGDNVGIGGFIITGSAAKYVLLRGLGPSEAHGFRDVVDDPVLELHGPGGFGPITNDNWRDTQEEEIESTGLPPTHDLESAIAATLSPGAYTAVLRGNNQSTGSALVEIYDLSQTAPAKLANISTRAFVGTDEDIVIAGFILGGNSGDDRVVARGIGPSLAAVGVPNGLADPTLELRDGNGALLGANNDWQDDPVQADELTAAGLAPTSGFESGLVMTLPPGQYTALLSGLNEGTGIGVVEVYDLGAP